MKGIKLNRGKSFTESSLLPGLLSLVFFLVNLLFLTRYPFIHSDETWLGGLSRTMVHFGDVGVTEYFFDLYPRYPHAVKILFHLLEIGWISIFGYTLFSLRLMSLTAATMALLILNNTVLHMTKRKWLSVYAMLLAAVDIQFIYAAHTARQEIWLVLLVLAAINFMQIGLEAARSAGKDKSGKKGCGRRYIISSGIVAGIAFGFHPNGVFAAVTPLILLICANCFNSDKQFLERRHVISSTACFIVPLLLIYTGIIITSLILNPRYFTDYAAYGSTLGVTDSLLVKIGRYPGYYKKLFYQVSGTYHTPNIVPQAIFYVAILVLALVFLFMKGNQGRRDKLLPLLTSLAGFQIIYIAIGRYGQPSVILNLPLLVILTAITLDSALDYAAGMKRTTSGSKLMKGCRLLEKRMSLFLTVIFLAAAGYMLLHGTAEIYHSMQDNSPYQEYLSEIDKAVPDDAIVLGNINAEPLFAVGNLYDWRNIGFLGELIGAGDNDAEEGFGEYIMKRNIDYIIYPEEMDFIYHSRPMWNGVYGNIAPLYLEMKEFLETECTLVHQFPSRTYAMRIVRYQQEREWGISIYRVNW